MSGAGHRVRPDRPPGDLEILIDVLPHPFFRRSGDDVLATVPITFTQAALGGEVEVPTLDGKAVLKIPPGTHSHRVFRMQGKGIGRLHGSGRGDQLVRVVIHTPDAPSKREKQLLEELMQIQDGNVPPPRGGIRDRSIAARIRRRTPETGLAGGCAKAPRNIASLTCRPCRRYRRPALCGACDLIHLASPTTRPRRVTPAPNRRPPDRE